MDSLLLEREGSLEFSAVADLCRELDYRDKFRLAQLLIQLGRKEEEGKAPVTTPETSANLDNIQYVGERLLKLRPSRRSALNNSISAMLQFQGGISEADVDKLVKELQRLCRLGIDDKGRVSYPEVAHHP